MSGLEWVLLSAIAVLAVLVLGGLFLGLRVLRRIGAGSAAATPSESDPAFQAEKDRREESLSTLRDAAEEATAAVENARTAAEAARTEAAAAKAEASAARAEARRVLDTARTEADTILERAHRQAEQ